MSQLDPKGYLSLYDESDKNSLYLMNMTSSISNIVSSDNTLFPNTVYGAAKANSHV